MRARKQLYTKLKHSLRPNYSGRFENLQHAYAKARVADMLRRAGYDFVHEEVPVPCPDLIDLTYTHPFVLDVYGEKSKPENWPRRGPIVMIERLPRAELADRVAFEISGLSTYHSANRRSLNREKRKKEMICETYDIDPSRYIVCEKDQLFSTRYVDDDETLIRQFGLKL